MSATLLHAQVQFHAKYPRSIANQRASLALAMRFLCELIIHVSQRTQVTNCTVLLFIIQSVLGPPVDHTVYLP